MQVWSPATGICSPLSTIPPSIRRKPASILLSPSDADRTQLVLSTIHSAKGLEWDAVFVIGLAEGRFPHQNTVPGEQWEEERRLLYVAATRARMHLFLSYPRELMTPDRKFNLAVMSPFLREINPGLYERREDHPGTSTGFEPVRPARVSARAGFPAAQPAEFIVGMLVKPSLFRPGQESRTFPGPRRVEVSFDRHGDKILHLDYARLEVSAEHDHPHYRRGLDLSRPAAVLQDQAWPRFHELLLESPGQSAPSCFHAVHIAGTNGKGSVGATLQTILQQAGYTGSGCIPLRIFPASASDSASTMNISRGRDFARYGRTDHRHP